MPRPDPGPSLTPRESEVLELIREGLTEEEVALRLDVSPAGANYYVAQVLSKLGVPSREAAATWTPPKEGWRPRSAASSVRLPSLKVTPIKGLLLALVVLVAGFYGYGLLIYQDHRPAGRTEVKVQWQQVDPPSMEARELPHPIAASVLGADDTWRAYVVEGAGPPRLVLETNRFLSGIPVWDPAGRRLTFGFVSRPERAATTAASANRIVGYTAVELPGGQKAWEQVLAPMVSAQISPSGDRILITDSRQGFSRSDLYILDLPGTSRRLSGLTNATGATWSPDGRWLLVAVNRTESGAQANSRVYYLVSTTEPEAVEIGRFTAPPQWSYDGGRLAAFLGEDLVVFDAAERRETRIGLNTKLEGIPRWSTDGRFVAHLGGAVELATGRVIPVTVFGTAITTVSPGGAWTASGTDASACPRFTSLELRTGLGPNRTFVRNVASGQESTLVDCGDTGYSSHIWLSDSALVLGGSFCAADCPQLQVSLALATLPGGQVRNLTNGREEGAEMAVSPDRRRLLVSGAELRVYSITGALERRITPPEGFLVTRVSWSPDGNSFAYVVAPKLKSAVSIGGPGTGLP